MTHPSINSIHPALTSESPSKASAPTMYQNKKAYSPLCKQCKRCKQFMQLMRQCYLHLWWYISSRDNIFATVVTMHSCDWTIHKHQASISYNCSEMPWKPKGQLLFEFIFLYRTILSQWVLFAINKKKREIKLGEKGKLIMSFAPR